jgi:SSS family transporter
MQEIWRLDKKFKTMEQTLSSGLILTIIIAYFCFLILISFLTGRKADQAGFFIGNKNSAWIMVAIGMIGTSLSGVTFISLPGAVGNGGMNQSLSYMQMVFGYLIGYFIIASVLLPLYYRLNLTSIYTFLGNRFGREAHLTGSAYFLLSRTVGAAFRLFLVAGVLQAFVTGPMGIPFWLTVAATIVLIWIYTFSGGIKTIIVTDTIQTICMILAVILTLYAIGNSMGIGITDIPEFVHNGQFGQMIFTDKLWSDGNNFWKQLISGALIALAMTGLDQDMMQKNLSCKTLKDAQKNMLVFCVLLVFVNLIFLYMGAMLYEYAALEAIIVPERPDHLYPTIALNHLGPLVGVFFVLGLIAAAYSSADSALTALTTAFCIDFLKFETSTKTAEEQKRTRLIVHVAFSLILFIVILLFNALPKDSSIINQIFVAAGYTYGPLLGLFVFGLLFKELKPSATAIIGICISAPILSYLLNESLKNTFSFGSTILAVNGVLTFILLYAFSKIYSLTQPQQ